MSDDYQRMFGPPPPPGVSYEQDAPHTPRGPQGPKAPAKVTSLRQEVFILYRPLMTCVFCKRRLFKPDEDPDGKALGVAPDDYIPDSGTEYLCPHTRIKEYHDLLARSVQNEVTIIKTDTTTLMNGTAQTVVTWVTYAK